MKSYIHNIPGRLRIKNYRFKDSDTQYAIRQVLVELGHGIGTAEFNSITGSLLIHYNAAEIKVEDILHALESHGFYKSDQIVTNDEAVHKLASTVLYVGWNLAELFI